MTTTMSNLPKELSEEILSRVPLKSVRLTCRKWNDLCQSQSFRKLHLGRLSAAMKEGETQMVAVIGNNCYQKSIVVDKEDPSIEHKDKLSLLDEQYNISDMFHCEGLLLCIVEGDSRFLAWNPYLGQTRWIEPIVSHRWFRYALGYEDKKKDRSLKLLYYYWVSNKGCFGYEMYDFDSDKWRTLDISPQEIYSCGGVSLKGNTYWCAREKTTDTQVIADHIICFDFTRERFGPLLPLPFSAVRNDDIVTLSSVREERLAVLLNHNDEEDLYDQFEIWITTKIEAQEVSWSKFWKMDLGVMALDRKGSFFIDEERKVVMGYYQYSEKFVIVGESGYVSKLDFLGEPADPNWTPHLCAYAPSLLQIKRKEATVLQFEDLPLLKMKSHHAGGRKRSKRMRDT